MINIWRMKNDGHDSPVPNSLIFCVCVSDSCGLLSLSAPRVAFPCWTYSWQIQCKVVDMPAEGTLAGNILAEGILAEGIHAEGILVEGM